MRKKRKSAPSEGGDGDGDSASSSSGDSTGSSVDDTVVAAAAEVDGGVMYAEAGEHRVMRKSATEGTDTAVEAAAEVGGEGVNRISSLGTKKVITQLCRVG